MIFYLIESVNKIYICQDFVKLIKMTKTLVWLFIFGLTRQVLFDLSVVIWPVHSGLTCLLCFELPKCVLKCQLWLNCQHWVELFFVGKFNLSFKFSISPFSFRSGISFFFFNFLTFKFSILFLKLEIFETFHQIVRFTNSTHT